MQILISIHMLPDFKKVKKNLNTVITWYLENRKSFHSTGFEDAGRNINHEGNKSEIKRMKDEPEEIEMHEISSSISFDKTIVENGNIDAILAKIDEIGYQIALKEQKVVFEEIIKLSKKNGQFLDISKLDALETMLKGFEKVNIEFTKEGTPVLPKMFSSNSFYQALEDAKIKSSNKIKEFEKKFNELLELKRQDFNERENSRKLVD